MNETVRSFLVDLRRIADNCNFVLLLDRMVRNRLVCGLRDKKLSVCESVGRRQCPNFVRTLVNVRYDQGNTEIESVSTALKVRGGRKSHI